MATPADIRNPELKTALGEAFRLLRAGDGTGAVKESAAALLRFIEIYPAYRTASVPIRDTTMPRMMRWPAYGANLKLEEGTLQIEFTRERFSVSEAMTCYQFLLEEILAVERGSV